MRIRYVFILVYVFVFLSPQYLSAQKNELHGKVLNASTKQAIAFANLSIKGYPIGVCTNEVGEFNFHIPERNYNDTLFVSSIGYGSFECLIAEINEKDSLNILLGEQVYELSDAIILPEETLNKIIKKVTKNLRKNYPRWKYMLNGFYREMVLKDNTYTRLIEAAIDIQKSGVNSEVGDFVRVNELRKSNSYVEYDWKSKLFNFIYGETNYLYKVLFSDIVSYHDKSYSTKKILTNEFTSQYDFVLENIIMLDSVKTYKIRFYDKRYYDEYGGNFSAIENHWIYVREDNYAIIKYESKHQIVKNSDRYKTVNFEDGCMFSSTVYYKEYQGKNYPYLYETMRIINAKGADEETGKGKQYIKATLLVNNILTQRKDYEKIKAKFTSPDDVELYNQNYTYNPEFWDTYNIIKLNPLYKQAKKSLEIESTLEEQFVENGK